MEKSVKILEAPFAFYKMYLFFFIFYNLSYRLSVFPQSITRKLYLMIFGYFVTT